MLESARASSFAEDTPLTGGGLQQFEKMRDEHFADVAAETGSFGFAQSIEEQLAQYVDGHGGM
nr:rod-binding protein [Erythrobacter crassostrea]